MRQVEARKNYVLLNNDGSIHYPFTKYLTHEFTNPNTRELVSQALRIFYRFCTAHKIELAVRAIEGRCLTHDEAEKLADLCYRPLDEVDNFTDKKIIFITSARAGKAPSDLPNAVEPNTAKKRLYSIGDYLDYYRDVFLDPNIRSEPTRNRLKGEYEKITKKLKNKIRGTKQGHHHQIQSLPSDKFLEIIKAVFQRPEEVFLSNSGKPSRTMYRDRAMVLLGCEGLRPGAIGNIARSDFRPDSKHLDIRDHREKRGRPSSGNPVLKLGASTQVNSASETMIQLMPITIYAIQKYIDTERNAVLSKNLNNRSAGFLLLNEKGEPIKHRSTLTAMFARIGKRLAELDLLNVGNDPYFKNKKRYDFYGYVLRHSSASFYVQEKGTEEKTLDSMRIRYGWTLNSNQPQRYANRALSDKASVDLMGFNQSLMTEVNAKQKNTGDK
jgi:integrase